MNTITASRKNLYQSVMIYVFVLPVTLKNLTNQDTHAKMKFARNAIRLWSEKGPHTAEIFKNTIL